MEDFILIKNGLVLTLDRKGTAGYFNILVRNGKIYHIDNENKFNEKEFISKYPDTLIIDAADRIIMPGFFNSKLISSYSLNKYFFKKCTYENLNSWLSLKLTERFLTAKDNSDLNYELFGISHARSLLNGELFISESSSTISKEFFDKYFKDSDQIKQYFNLTVYDYGLLTDITGQEKNISLGFRTDEDINNYSLASMKKVLSGNKLRLFIDASLSQGTFESVKKDFGKPFITVLSEMELLSQGTVISNPTHLNQIELDILCKKGATILLSPSDYLNFQDKKTDLDEIFLSGLNIITGTGYTGDNIFAELKILSSLISKNVISSEELLKTAIRNPSQLFGISNITGSIERNKSADMIILSLEDIRNVPAVPETESEILADFIIRNLSAKDISDVILRGRVLVRDKKLMAEDSSLLRKKSEEISARIYSEGKYFEYKEKYLMRGRVDKIKADRQEKKSEEIYVDITETENEYMGEGEFIIVGRKQEEFEQSRGKAVIDETNNIEEISSLEDGVDFLDKNESQEISVHTYSKGASDADNLKGHKTDAKSIPENVEEINQEKEKENIAEPVIRKEKLKFGFGEEDTNKKV